MLYIFDSIWLFFLFLPQNTANLPSSVLFETFAITEGSYFCDNGRINLRSNAPLEIIEAESNKLRGLLDPSNQTFAWSVEIKTLDGFNSPLQQEHFNENYMETKRFPKATFTGKIIEKIDIQRDGQYTVRAKGKLTVHGVVQERILKGFLTVKKKNIRIQASFMVPLADHSITIPKIVFQKISEEMFVSVDATLQMR